MTGTPLLVASLALVGLSVAGFVGWTLVPPPVDPRAQRIIELAATIALEASRADHVLDAREIELIEDAIRSRVEELGSDESAGQIINRLLKQTAHPGAAARALEELMGLTDDKNEQHWVLEVLSQVIFADHFVEPEEAYFFYKAASRMGLSKEQAAERYGIEGMATEEVREALEDQALNVYMDEPPEGSGL